MEISKELVTGSAGRLMLANVRWNHGSKDMPVIIFVHGFKGFMDWGPFPLVCERLAEAGFVVVSFNFSHNGTTPEQPLDFADLEAFGNNNYTKELNDLGSIVDWVCGKSFPVPAEKANPQQLFLIGHSRGGGDVILKAFEDTRVKAIATWAAVDAFGRWFDEDELARWEKEGVLYTYNSRTGQDMPMYYQMRLDFLNNSTRLDIPYAAPAIHIPWLIVHGTKDHTVEVDAAHRLHALQPNSRLVIVEGGDHTFGGRHPWREAELPEKLETVVIETAGFFKKIADHIKG
jgi:uncharacterized protein